jgi:hypothetical protein
LEAEEGVHGEAPPSEYQTGVGKPLSLLDFAGTEEVGAVIKVNLKEESLPPEPTVSPAPKPGVVGNSLDRFIGIWSEEEASEFLKSIEVFEEIDESMWS